MGSFNVPHQVISDFKQLKKNQKILFQKVNKIEIKRTASALF